MIGNETHAMTYYLSCPDRCLLAKNSYIFQLRYSKETICGKLSLKREKWNPGSRKLRISMPDQRKVEPEMGKVESRLKKASDFDARSAES